MPEMGGAATAPEVGVVSDAGFFRVGLRYSFSVVETSDERPEVDGAVMAPDGAERQSVAS